MYLFDPLLICVPLFYLHFNCFVVRSLLLFECTASIKIIIGLQHMLLQVAAKLQLTAHRVIIYIVILSPEICWLQVYRCGTAVIIAPPCVAPPSTKQQPTQIKS